MATRAKIVKLEIYNNDDMKWEKKEEAERQLIF